MAFETTQQKISAVNRAGNVLGLIKTIHAHASTLAQALATYQAGTDPALNAAVNALFSAAERTEIVGMIDQLSIIKADWETNHPWVSS